MNPIYNIEEQSDKERQPASENGDNDNELFFSQGPPNAGWVTPSAQSPRQAVGKIKASEMTNTTELLATHMAADVSFDETMDR